MGKQATQVTLSVEVSYTVKTLCFSTRAGDAEAESCEFWSSQD